MQDKTPRKIGGVLYQVAEDLDFVRKDIYLRGYEPRHDRMLKLISGQLVSLNTMFSVGERYRRINDLLQRYWESEKR